MKAIADRWGWQETVKIGVVLAWGVLGLFVSTVLGFGLYVMSLPLALSIWGYGDSVVMLLVWSTGIGAALGSFITWFDRDFNLGRHALVLVVLLVCSLLGAWLGLQRGIDVGAIHPIWKPGIPETSVTVMGTVISANIPMLALRLYRAVKDPRL